MELFDEINREGRQYRDTVPFISCVSRRYEQYFVIAYLSPAEINVISLSHEKKLQSQEREGDLNSILKQMLIEVWPRDTIFIKYSPATRSLLLDLTF
jgi:hypothetical protein